MSINERYELLHMVGHSNFSNTSMYLAKNNSSRKLVVVKLTDLDETSSEFLEIITKELWMCHTLCHQNVLVHQTSFTMSSKLYVVNELMKFGSCTDIIESHFVAGMPEKSIAFVLKQVLKALSYLHTIGLLHRGVKGGHIFVSDRNTVKLGGNRNVISGRTSSGKTKNIHDYPKHDTFSLPWFSPEILQQNMEGYNYKSDIYSLGITACELANGYAPFTDMSSTQMLLEKLQGTKPSLLDKSTIPLSSFIDPDSVGKGDNASKYQIERQTRLFSSHFHDFVLQCLHQKPAHRPSTYRLLQHRFFEQAADIDLTRLLRPLVPISSDSINSYTETMTEAVNLSVKNREIAGIAAEDWDFSVC